MKRRKQIDDAEKEEAWQKKQQRRRVSRAPILNGSTLSGGTLAREYGNATSANSGRSAAQALVSGWSAAEIMSSKGIIASEGFSPYHAYDGYS